MYAHVPPLRCASATTCIASVDLPDDSGPKISTILPRPRPPPAPGREAARERARGDRLDADVAALPQLHDRSLAELLLDLPESHLESLLAVHLEPLLCVSARCAA